jgi:hypothetical protein
MEGIEKPVGRVLNLAYFGFLRCGARHRTLSTAYSAPHVENPNYTQIENTSLLRRVGYFLAAVASLTLIATTAVPQQAVAAPNTTLKQTILPPDCYDVAMQNGDTMDYIATWDCELRMPDGSIYSPSN